MHLFSSENKSNQIEYIATYAFSVHSAQYFSSNTIIDKLHLYKCIILFIYMHSEIIFFQNGIWHLSV